MLPRLALTFVIATVVCLPARTFAQSLDTLGTALSHAEGQSTQPEPDLAAPAHVSHVDGTAVLEREGRAETSPLNMPLLSGDRLKTIDGRVEVLFADGGALHLDARTTVDFQSDDLARLIEGRLRLNIPGPARSIAYRIDSPAGSVRISQPGEYRIALVRGEQETQLELAVLRGAGEVFTDLGATPVRAGERAYASAGLAPSYAYSYNSANWDAFDRWSETRRDVRMGVSAQYLPSDMRTYASTFDDHGDWRYEQSYGQVWYPRVAADWRPYYNGRWASYPRYGWTWIGADRFAWPTHHYGRWGFSAGAWFWIPGNRWAPAHVSWGYAPGYVSWCPLGFDNRPVIAINIFNGRHHSWRGWTSVSRGHFGRDYVHHRAVNWDRVDRARRPDFRVVRSAPVAADYAVPRNSTPIVRVGSNSGSRNAGRGFAPAGAVPSRAGSLSPGVSPSRAGSLSPGVSPSRAGSMSPGASPSRAGSPLSPSAGRDVAVPRGTNPTRYINRGDEIVRSQTERPTAPPADIQRRAPGADGPAGFARPRTAPDGPARRVAPAPGVPSPVASPMPSPSFASPSPARAPVPQNYGRPRGYEPRPQPSPERSASPPERSAPTRQRPSTGAQGVPSRVEGRAAPTPAPAPAARPRDTAVPRRPSTGAQGAPSRVEGRSGGFVGGAGAGARSRGRGGA